MKEKTWGAKVLEHRQKNPILEDDPREYRKVMEVDIIKELYATVQEALLSDNYQNKDFYIQVIASHDGVHKMPYIRYFARQSCPYPACNEALYKYHHISGELEFFWQIPLLWLYKKILANPDYYLKHPEYDHLAKAAILMDKGELDEIADRENGYKKDGIIIRKEDLDGR